MTQQYADNLHEDILNRKKACRGMCAVTIMLFLTNLLSYASAVFITQALYGSWQIKLISGLQKLICLFGVSKTDAFLAAKQLVFSGAFLEFVNMLLSLVILVLPTFIFSKVTRLTFDESFPLKGKLVKRFFAIYGTSQLFVIFAGNLSTGLYDFFFPKSGVDPGGFTDFSEIEFDGYMLFIRIISVCIFVPIIEEYVFRGVFFGYLRRYGTMYAVFASAAIFGIAHSNPSQSVYALVFGIFACFLTAVTGNIKTSILFHMLNNLTSIINEQITAYASENVTTIIFCLTSIITIFAGFIGLYIIAKKGGLADSFTDMCKKENQSRKIIPGMKQIMVVPFIAYGLLYAYDVIKAAISL